MPPTVPSSLPNYLAEGLPKQDDQTLRDAREFIDELLAAREQRREQPISEGTFFALFCRRLTAASNDVIGGFRQANREMDAVWRYGTAQTASVDVSKPCQTAR